MASHYAKKAARAEARSAAKAAGGAAPGVGVGEKAQLAAYYAAKDAVEQNQAGGTGTSSSLNAAPPITTAVTNAVSGNGSGFHSSADQWRPKYNSLYDDSDVDLWEPGKGAKSTAPPPLPPKIPIGGSGIKGTPSTGWA